METCFEYKSSYNKTQFQLTNKPGIDEREIHGYHEILYFIEGDAVLLTEDRQERVGSDSLLLIPRECYHFFRFRRGETFLRLKISIPSAALYDLPVSGVMASVRIFTGLNERLRFVLREICRALEEEGVNSGFYAYAAFVHLLAVLDRSESAQSGEKDWGTDPMIPKIVRYISEHISEDLSIGAMAEKMNVSSSGITHGFKREMGISVHEYVKQKRMFRARNLIMSGQKPSKIFPNCGYQDYSSFYKAYLSFFGYPPSKEKGDYTPGSPE